MKYGILFSVIAILFTIPASQKGGWYFLLLWPSFSFAIVAAGYLILGPKIYGKSAQGELSLFNQLLLLPYLLILWFIWYSVRFISRESAYHQITENIYIGRRLLNHELPKNIKHVVDLTSEFNEPLVLRNLSYYSFPILDGYVPQEDQLTKWVKQVSNLSGDIYIHCAEGHGRTGLFTACLLLQIGHSKTVNESVQFIQSKRPLVKLQKEQLKLLITIYRD